jgi:hypothetical protein
MARDYDIYRSAARCVRGTHYVPDLKLNHHCQGGYDLNATPQNIAEGYLRRLISYTRKISIFGLGTGSLTYCIDIWPISLVPVGIVC